MDGSFLPSLEWTQKVGRIFHLHPMSSNSPPRNWEEEEVDNPIGCTQWVFNSLTKELTVRSTVEIEEGEDVPWHELRFDFESAVLLEGVVSICDRAFGYCLRLGSVQIPKSVKSIEDGVFAYCVRLKSISIPDSVEVIGSRAFTENHLSSIKIPRSVTSFRGNSFGCFNLKVIDISENPNFVFVDGEVIDKGKTQIIYYTSHKSRDYPSPAQ